VRHHNLVVIGSGSGNMVIDDSFADSDVAIIEERKVGGTCVNFGCIPSKMLAYTAEVADTVADADAFGIDAGRPQEPVAARYEREHQWPPAPVLPEGHRPIAVDRRRHRSNRSHP
jgi:mycothione reductase